MTGRIVEGRAVSRVAARSAVDIVICVEWRALWCRMSPARTQRVVVVVVVGIDCVCDGGTMGK